MAVMKLLKRALECAAQCNIEAMHKVFEQMDSAARTEFQENIVKTNKKQCQEKFILTLIANAEKECENGNYFEMERIFIRAFEYVLNFYFGNDEESKKQKYSIRNSLEKCFGEIAKKKTIEFAESLIRKSALFNEKEAGKIVHICEKAVKHSKK